MIERGHTVRFKKRLKENITERTLLFIEKGSIGFIVDVGEDETHVKLQNRDLTIALHRLEVDEYLARANYK